MINEPTNNNLIQINPNSLNNLEYICKILYKLHPSVLNELVEMERSLGNILGIIDLNNISQEEIEFLSNTEWEEYNMNEEEEQEDFKNILNYRFDDLRKYIQLDTDEYIPIKIYIEVEDPVIRRKVRELVKTLEKTRALDEFYNLKKEEDEYAYFAEGYGLTMNDEQKKQRDDIFLEKNVEGLERLLREKILYP